MTNRQVAEFCENGAKAIADEATTKRVTPEFFREHSLDDLRGQSDHWLGQQGRLTHPMVKRRGATHYEPISWDDAFQLIAAELNALPITERRGVLYEWPDEQRSGLSVSTFRAAIRHQQSAGLLEHVPRVERRGDERNHRGRQGLREARGFRSRRCDFHHRPKPGNQSSTDAHQSGASEAGTRRQTQDKIVSINPLPEVGNFRFKNPQDLKNPIRAAAMLFGGGTKLSDLWLPVRINGDVAVLKGMMKEMLAEEEKRPGSVFDLEFIRNYTAGYDDFIANLRASSWDDILVSSGLTREQIREAAEIAMASKRIICCWAMGLTQHKNAVATIQEIMNFLLLGGNIGRPGAGPCPVRGHSNVQGDRTMGIWERMNDGFLDKLGNEFNFAPPREHGTDTVETIKQMHDGKIRVFVAMGGNFLSATPDTEYTAKALQRCRLTAHVSIKLNRSHLITGDIALILPCLGRSEIDRQTGGEQFVTTEDSMGIINSSRGVLEPASEHLLSEPAIVAGLAQATLGARSKVDWKGLTANYDRVRDHIAHVIPGFERFNERIAQDVFYLPNEARDHRKFNNEIGKAKFTIHSIPRNELEPGRFIMMTIRSHDQFNTHIYGLDDRYRGIHNGRRVIFMNPEDVKEAGLIQGQFVDLTSHYGENEERVAQHFQIAPYDIPRGCTATYFPEANVLVPINSVADRSNTPTSKFVIISIAPSPDVEAAVQELRVAAREPASLSVAPAAGKSAV